MNPFPKEYAMATRHAYTCTVFVLPLLVAYEAGIWMSDAEMSETLRNGADTWLRWLLEKVRLRQSFWPGIFLGTGMVGWAWGNWKSKPNNLFDVWMGMVLESALFAMGLWGISLVLGPLLDFLDIPLLMSTGPDPAVQLLLAYLGAGIYEEALFRLLAIPILCYLFQLGELPKTLSLVLAIGTSALLFATAHHVGPMGEPFSGFVFLFRTIAGVYFALIFRFRGFGIAVGAHALYDILVGVILADL